MRKMLVAASAIIAGVVVICWVIGGSMSRHEVVVSISAPPEKVFPWMHRPALISRWLGGFVESVPLTPGGPRVGARSRDVFEERGRKIEMTTEIAHFDPPHAITVRIESSVMNGTSSFELSASGEGETQVRFVSEASYKGFTRVLAPFIRGMVQKRHEEDLGRLKRAVEGEARN